MGRYRPIAFGSETSTGGSFCRIKQSRGAWRSHALVTSPLPMQHIRRSREVQEIPAPRKPERDTEREDPWLWHATKSMASGLLGFLTASRLPPSEAKAAPTSDSQRKSDLLGDTTQRAIEVVFRSHLTSSSTLEFGQSSLNACPAKLRLSM